MVEGQRSTVTQYYLRAYSIIDLLTAVVAVEGLTRLDS